MPAIELFAIGDIAQVDPTNGLNIRTEPRVAAGRLFGIVKGTKVRVLTDAITPQGDTLIWYKIEVVNGPEAGRSGFAAFGYENGSAVYLKKLTITPPPPPPPPTSNWKVGWHFVASGTGLEERQISDLTTQMKQAGKTLRSALVVNAVNAANQLLGLSPSTWLAFRFRFAIPLPGGGEEEVAPSHSMFAFNAAEYSKVCLPVFRQVPGAKVYQLANEWMHDDNLDLYTKEVDFYINSMKIYHDLGMKIMFGDWAVVHPDYTNAAIRTQNDRLFKAAEQYEAIANLHVYSPTLTANPKGNDSMLVEFNNWAGRIVAMAKLYPNVKFVGGEAGLGQANYLGDQKFRQIVTELQDMVKNIPNILWLMLWTLGGSVLNGWQRSDCGLSIPSYVQIAG